MADNYLEKHYETLPEEDFDGETTSLSIYDEEDEEDDVNELDS